MKADEAMRARITQMAADCRAALDVPACVLIAGSNAVGEDIGMGLSSYETDRRRSLAVTMTMVLTAAGAMVAQATGGKQTLMLMNEDGTMKPCGPERATLHP